MWYIKIEKLNGRRDFYNLADQLDNIGVEAYYYEGGWQDNTNYVYRPHLAFKNREDAIVYSLAFGGEVTKEIPLQK